MHNTTLKFLWVLLGSLLGQSVASLVLVLLVAGCRGSTANVATSNPSQAQPLSLDRVPKEVAEEAKRRVPNLRENMTLKEVYAFLGLSEYEGQLHCTGGGSLGNFWLLCRLRDEYQMQLVFDENQKAKSVSIGDASWFKRP